LRIIELRKRSWLVISALLILVVVISIIITLYFYPSIVSSPIQTVDRFGTDEIYPTKEGGREWYVNMEDPFADPLFSNTFDRNIVWQTDGSWLIEGPAIRLNVGTPALTKLWKNVEITGYVKVVQTISSTNDSNDEYDSNNDDITENQDFENDLDWRARGGRHNNEIPCDGTAYAGTIDVDGNVRWKKEIWHLGGYTDARAIDKVTDSILGRWIGWKVIMYNINNNSAVKLESYLDDKNNNEWKKVVDLIDKGGWYAQSSDNEFYSANCGRPTDYIITNGGPIVTFRSDDVAWQFKNLSVREIDPIRR
jgi:hypothetical protein